MAEPPATVPGAGAFALIRLAEWLHNCQQLAREVHRDLWSAGLTDVARSLRHQTDNMAKFERDLLRAMESPAP